MPLLFGAMLAMLGLLMLAPSALTQEPGPPTQEEIDSAVPCEEVFGEGSVVCNAPVFPETGTACPPGTIPAGEGCQGDPAATPAEQQAGLERFEAGLVEAGLVPVAEEQEPAAPVSCDDFTTQFQAQQFFDFNATPEEQAILDPDGNGFACDSGQIVFGEDPAEAPTPVDETAPPEAAPPEAAPGAAADATALPDTGGPALLLPLAGLMVAAGLGLAFIRRR